MCGRPYLTHVVASVSRLHVLQTEVPMTLATLRKTHPGIARYHLFDTA